MLRLGMEEDVPIESKLITKRIAAAQKAVEAQNFAARKHLLEYDDVMNKQRQAVYGMRRNLLEGMDQRDRILDIVRGIIASFVDSRVPESAAPHSWDLDGLQTDINTQFGVRIDPVALRDMNRAEIEDAIYDQCMAKYEAKEQLLGPDGGQILRETERMIMLNVIDNQWKDHLLSMDHLKEGIGLRGYGQKDPLVEYKKESFVLFQDMMDRIEDETIRFLFFLQPYEGQRPPLPYPDEDEMQEIGPSHDGDATNDLMLPAGNGANGSAAEHRAAQHAFEDFTKNIQKKKEKELAELQFVGGDGSSSTNKQAINSNKVGRNDPCPCGSGKKYKKCHGAA
jgi:preprotein translocase subunit SecA